MATVAAFVGRAGAGPTNAPVAVRSSADFERQFGGASADLPLTLAVADFYRNGGAAALIVRLSEPGGGPRIGLSERTYLGNPAAKTGLYALQGAASFDILCIPPDALGGDTPLSVYRAAAEYCVARRAMLIIDPPKSWQAKHAQSKAADIAISDLGPFSPEAARSAAVYFPRLAAPRPGGPPTAASGAIAGMWAATDAARGPWKAPAGVDAALKGVAGLAANVTDAQTGPLNVQGINSLRKLPGRGLVVWGARTLAGADRLADDYKYIPVRRTALYITKNVSAETRWAAFEPNGEQLWARIRSSVGTFMDRLFRQGAFQGSTPREAYFVRCDAATTAQADIDAGVVNIVIGFAPLKPAEFIIVEIQQIAGQAA